MNEHPLYGLQCSYWLYTQNHRYVAPAHQLVQHLMRRNMSKGDFTETDDEVVVRGSVQLSQSEIDETIKYYEQHSVYCQPIHESCVESGVATIECRFKKQC
ncbi:MAG: hypothetical protein Homavirus3_14 [Homavirus sp.]|uniref:Uncharacterized protein n=1 Tax=Homavirus sp. TaxID=2487769 RepID=A0A3G5A475_9VIRU|nr:MAG: hypothetical protein Homavirus3_14 [Homavirus sp.]